jgi:hypothetical protein
MIIVKTPKIKGPFHDKTMKRTFEAFKLLS